MSSHEYMTQRFVADRRDHLLAQAEIHRARRDVPAPPRGPSFVTRLMKLMARSRRTTVAAPSVRTRTPAPEAAPTV